MRVKSVLRAPVLSPGFFLVFVICLQSSSVDAQEICFTEAGAQSTCILIQECQPILQILRTSPKPLSAEIRQRLVRAQCGFQGRQPKVCCPPEPRPTPTPVTRPRPNTSSAGASAPPDVSRHRNLALLPQNCGQLEEENRVLGGNKTSVFEFPWMALISYSSRRGLSFKCAGTIINSRYILTAAHCITSLESGQTLAGVRVGEHNINTEQDCDGTPPDLDCAPPYQDFSVEEAVPHPGFTSRGLQDDIGLLRLSEPIQRQYNALPICLPLGSPDRDLVLEGRALVVAGWGATETGLASPELLKVNLPVLRNERCAEKYNSSITIGYRQLCAGGEGGVDSCGGDSGGPLKLQRDTGEISRFVQFGVVSFGPRRCGTKDMPGVYTRVIYYTDWILDNLKP